MDFQRGCPGRGKKNALPREGVAGTAGRSLELELRGQLESPRAEERARLAKACPALVGLDVVPRLIVEQIEDIDDTLNRLAALQLIEQEDIPRYKELRDDWPLDSDAFCALAELAHNDLPRDYLLGYPSYFTLGYDPTPGPDWIQLLTLDSHEQFGWNWHDTAKLMVFIEKDRLARKDFSYLKCDAG